MQEGRWRVDWLDFLTKRFCENSHFNGFSKGLLKQGEFSSHSGSPKIKMNATVGFQADGFPGPYWFLLAKASSSSSSEIQKYWGKISGRYLISRWDSLEGFCWKDLDIIIFMRVRVCFLFLCFVFVFVFVRISVFVHKDVVVHLRQRLPVAPDKRPKLM